MTRSGGVPVDDFEDSSSFPGRPIFDMSESGEFIVFRARLADGRVGAFRIRTTAAAIPMSDCTGNLATLSGGQGPSVGGAAVLSMDGGQAVGVVGMVAFAAQPIAGWPPCGLVLPGVGELVIDVTPGLPLFTVSGLFPSWLGFALPVVVPIPDQLSLLGQTVYAQGLFVDTSGVAPAEPLRLTNGVELRIGM